MILKMIGNDIYSIVGACPNEKEMWIAIERLQKRESINIQDVNTKLFWEFGKFTSRDGESIESYYTRVYRMINKMQAQDLDTVSYHKLFDILKQHQNEVNEIRAKRIARNANPLALNKGKEIVKALSPPSESTSEEDSDEEQAHRDKQIQNRNQVVQYSGIQCFNFKGFRYFAKECKLAKRVKDYDYHKEKMLLCKKEAKGIQLTIGHR
ncbi:hypothetical protein Tco_1382378 [Tanacetum coccineum]